MLQAFGWISLVLWIGVGIIVIGVLVLSIWMIVQYLAIRGHFDPSTELIGEIGTVKKECTPHQRGKVYVAGAYWDAVSEHGLLNVGDDIKVKAIGEKFLVVVKVELIRVSGEIK